MNCDCLGCKNVAKHQKPKRPNRGSCVPNESNDKCFERENNPNNLNCIPTSEVNKDFERNINTSDLYRTMNLPERFERTCKFSTNIQQSIVMFVWKFSSFWNGIFQARWMTMVINGKDTIRCFTLQILNMVGSRQMHTPFHIGEKYSQILLIFSTPKLFHSLTYICLHFLHFRYYPRSNEFSDLLIKSGMYRNYSLNTVMDKSRVWSLMFNHFIETASLFTHCLLVEIGVKKYVQEFFLSIFNEDSWCTIE